MYIALSYACCCSMFSVLIQLLALDQILDMREYDVPESFQLTTDDPERDIVLRIGDEENGVALQEDAQYMLELSVPFRVSDAAVHFTNKVLNVSIGDPDSEFY